MTTDSSDTGQRPPLNAERPDPPGDQVEAPDIEVAAPDDEVQPDSAGSDEGEAPD
ncbi:hypothetical protein [Actinoplanes xinjiangensis]|uniref:hypothetical protein n=1 Tax=Actinoplanes xinjiangensis TaxID=512350 RepID=UPI00343E7A04